MKSALFVLALSFLSCSVAWSAPASPQRPHAGPAKPAPSLPPGPETPPQATPQHAHPDPPFAETVDEKPIVTLHKITVGGKSLEYTATVGQMPLKNAAGDTEAHIFYMAYTLDGVADVSKRPLTFAFNGGPGSASIWVHVGAMGPRRAQLSAKGYMPAIPFKMVDNESTWLDQTDLVFIDPVGTGYSRAKTADVARRFNGVQGDFQSVAEFIRMYLARNDRWQSPLFIAGESYGTFRAAGLASTLIDKGIALSGIVMISTVLDFAVLQHDTAVGLPFALHLPSCTATAWYHKKLPPDLQKDLRSTLKEVEHWAMNDYLQALDKGSELKPAERKAVLDKLTRYTGLERRYLDNNELLVDAGQFTRELLRQEKLVIGSYDGRLTGPAPLSAGDHGVVDPAVSNIRPPFYTVFMHYMQSELGYKTDMEYNVLGGIMPWDWGGGNNLADSTDQLQNALYKNPHMKVLFCAGYYDLVTPYYSVGYTINHLGLHPEMRSRISQQFYEAGHMMYIDGPSRRKLKRDITDFIGKAASQQ